MPPKDWPVIPFMIAAKKSSMICWPAKRQSSPAIAALTKNSVLVVWKRDIGGNSSRIMPLRSITSVKSGKWNLEISTINGESVRPVSFGSPAIGQLASEINKLIS